MSNKTFIIIFIAIVIIGAFFRLYQLDLKPMHHDEGDEIFYFIKPLLAFNTLTWDFDNKGLMRHFISVNFIKLFGLSLFSLRFTPALLGILSLFLFYYFKKFFNYRTILISILFLAT